MTVDATLATTEEPTDNAGDCGAPCEGQSVEDKEAWSQSPFSPAEVEYASDVLDAQAKEKAADSVELVGIHNFLIIANRFCFYS